MHPPSGGRREETRAGRIPHSPPRLTVRSCGPMVYVETLKWAVMINEFDMPAGITKKKFFVNVREENYSSKKRKFSLMKEEVATSQSSESNEVFKKAFISSDAEVCKPLKDFPRAVCITDTGTITKVIADPGSLPCAPNIFQSNLSKGKESDPSTGFLNDFLTFKSFNTNINERFSNVFSDKNKTKKNKKKKIKKVKKEKTAEEKLKRTIINKEKWERKKLRKRELKQNDLMNMEASGSMSEFINTGAEFKHVSSKINTYRVPGKKALLFHMHYPSLFSFKGEIKVQTIIGEIEVLGYTSSKTSVEMYSPDFCMPLTVETKPWKESIPSKEVESVLKDFLKEEDYKTVLAEFKPNDSVILVEQIISTFGIIINKYFDRLLFPKDLEDVLSTTGSLKSLQSIFTFQLSKKGKYFRKSSEWDKIPLGHCTVLCGGKGVGKSTLLKYFINKFISLGENILCLDFDPGQSEFCFPGCLSAVVVNKPLLGPNFTHVMDPIIMTSFGDVDVSSNPSKYLNCVKYIIDTCRKNEELLKMKWFINTMGFCKGLGINLIITTLKLLNPNTVIQIKGSDYKNNYPFYLTPTTVNSRHGFRTVPLDDVNLTYDLRVIHSCAEKEKKQLQGGLKSRQLRDIMAISYFSKMVTPPFYNFNAVQPFLISFSKLFLGIDYLIDLNDVLKAFNGNTVSLSHFEPDNEVVFFATSEEDEYFKVVVKPTVAPSLGIGFVRGIDCQEKKFYIMTHLPLEALTTVNCLSLGRVSPPHSMFLKQETVEGETAYTTLGTIDTIQRVKRMFRVPGTPQNKENVNA